MSDLPESEQAPMDVISPSITVCIDGREGGSSADVVANVVAAVRGMAAEVLLFSKAADVMDLTQATTYENHEFRIIDVSTLPAKGIRERGIVEAKGKFVLWVTHRQLENLGELPQKVEYLAAFVSSKRSRRDTVLVARGKSWNAISLDMGDVLAPADTWRLVSASVDPGVSQDDAAWLVQIEQLAQAGKITILPEPLAYKKQRPSPSAALPDPSPESRTRSARSQQKAEFARQTQAHVVLLWAPISTSGLTTQLEQVCAVLREERIQFQISYHIKPSIDHPLTAYWVEPRDIDCPKLVLYFERFVEFGRGFDAAYKIFYVNLDWLSKSTISMSRVSADVILAPTPYKLDKLNELYPNSRVVYLPWPSAIPVRPCAGMQKRRGRIRVLYVGNDFDEKSRKHPQAVVDAILACRRNDLEFVLKFRSKLPDDIHHKLSSSPLVKSVIDHSISSAEMAALYERADINLIPNACEGNGLSILESWASGVVPAVLNGHPMTDVTTDQNSFRIACEYVGAQEQAPFYKTTSSQIVEFFDSLTRPAINAKLSAVADMQQELQERNDTLRRAIMSAVFISGYRTKGLRLRVQHAHLPAGAEQHWQPRNGERVKRLLLSDEGQGKYGRKARLIDVVLTTSKRAWCLEKTLPRLIESIEASPASHRLFIGADSPDDATLAVLEQYRHHADWLLSTKDAMGLPYMWNVLMSSTQAFAKRSERRADYICYIQDDCLISDPSRYFESMASLYDECMPGYMGFVSGYFTEVHPGFADFEWRGFDVIASDSVDGKNFMAPPRIFDSIGPLSWWFSDGSRRGNPGPVRGSHFDLWQWKEAPNSLLHQSRISLAIRGLCEHVAPSAEQSTWNNDTSDEAVLARVREQMVYATRDYGERQP